MYLVGARRPTIWIILILGNELTFSGSGHILQHLLDDNVSVSSGAARQRCIYHASQYFGSMDAMKEQFIEAAEKVRVPFGAY